MIISAQIRDWRTQQDGKSDLSEQDETVGDVGGGDGDDVGGDPGGRQPQLLLLRQC